MDVPRTNPPDDGEAAAGKCPVDHGGAPAASAEPAAGAKADPAEPAAAAKAAPAGPTIPALELPGSRMPSLLQVISHFKDPTGYMERNRRRYGSRFVLKRGIPPRRMYVLTDPDEVKQVFLAPNDVLHTGRSSVLIEKFIGHHGLAWLDEDDHKVRRRYIMPSMHGSALRRLEPVINEMAAKEVAGWPRGQVSLHPFSYRFTLNVIKEVLFGTNTPTHWDELVDAWAAMMEFANRFAALMVYHKMKPRTVSVLRAIRPIGLDLFMKRRALANRLLVEAIQERRRSTDPGDDLLSVLLQITHEDGTTLSDEELRDELLTIFLAGTETVAAAMAWSFLYLSHSEDARTRLVAEIDAGESDVFLTATINEVLRLRPSIPQIIAREVVKPIEINGVRYEPGGFLWASGYLMHRDPTIYPEPNEFRPERFLGRKPGTYSWIPFGGGRIRCLGSEIAMVEMKAVLRELLTQCEVGPAAPELEKPRSRNVIVIPRGGARVELRTRTRETSLAGT